MALDDTLAEVKTGGAPFGFRDSEMKHYVDKAGLLDGVAGIALALLSLAMDDEPGWDMPFLIG